MVPRDAIEDIESSLPLFLKLILSFRGIMLVDELRRRNEPSLIFDRNDATSASTVSAVSDMDELMS